MSEAVLAQVGLEAVMRLEQFMAQAKKYTDELDRMGRKNDTFAEIAKNAFDSVGNSFDRLFSSTLVTKAVGWLEKLVDEAGSATAVFQRLKIQFDTLAARDYAKAFGGTVQEALAKTSKQSKELLYWVREIAVTTPFTTESLGRSLAMAVAYGLNVTEAKRLVLAAGDFTAAFGQGNEVVERIIYNMGQMKAMGIVAGRQLRNLGAAFVPITDLLDIFGVKLDKDRKAIRQMFSTGEVSVKDFIDTFTTYVEETYPGSMERMQRTFTAVISNIKDYIQNLLGFEVLGPVSSEIAGQMQKIIQSMLNPEAYANAERAGLALLYVYERIMEVITPLGEVFKDFFASLGFGNSTTLKTVETIFNLGLALKFLMDLIGLMVSSVTKTLNKITESFGITFKDLIDKMFEWGKNIILSLARGMASAIQAVFNVIIAIGRAITKLLKGGSPPLLLPDLDKWGAEAMTVYMEGWLEGDFSAFNEIGDFMEKIIRSLKPGTSEEGLLDFIIGSRVAVGNAVEQMKDFGTVTQEVINKIQSSAGIASKELGDYLRVTLQLQIAQRDMNSQMKVYDDLLADLNSQLTQIENRQEQVSRVKEIDRTLNKVILTTDERERLELEKKQILLKQQIATTEAAKESYKNSAQANIDSLESQSKALRSLIEAQLGLNDAVSKAKQGVGGGATTTPEELPISELPDMGTIETGIEDIQKMFDELWTNLKADWDQFWKDLTLPFEPIQTQINLAIELFGGIFKDPKVIGAWQNFKTTIQTDWANIVLAFNNSGILDSLGTAIGKIVTWLTVSTDKTGRSLLDRFAEAIDNIARAIVIAMPGINDFIIKFGDKLVDEILPAIAGPLLDFLTNVLPGAIENLPATLTSLGNFINLIAPFLGFILEFKAMKFMGLPTWVADLVVAATWLDMLNKKFDPKTFGVGKAEVKLDNWWSTTFGPDSTFSKNWAGLSPQIEKIWDELFGSKGTFATIFAPKAKGTVDKGFSDIFGGEGSIIGMILGLGPQISMWWEGLFGEKGSVSIWCATLLTNMGLWFNGIFGPEGIVMILINGSILLVQTWWDGLWGQKGSIFIWWSTLQTNIGIWFQTIFGTEGTIMTEINKLEISVKTWWDGLWGPEGKIALWIKGIVNIGEDIANNIKKGFLNKAEAMKTSIINFVSGILAKIIWYVQQMLYWLGLADKAQSNTGVESPTGQAGGGIVVAGNRYKINEGNQTESFVPAMNGRILSAQQTIQASRPIINNIDRSVHLEMNPSYKNIQTEASVYMDAVAALSAIRR
jgi:tape measure domain-containing protein